MTIASMQLDPNAVAYTDDEIVGKVNTATVNINRAGSVDPAARPIVDAEVTAAKLAAAVAKANLDAMADTARGYVKTTPEAGEFPIVAIERTATGLLEIEYDDVPII